MEGREVEPRAGSDGHHRDRHPLGDGARSAGNHHRVGERERAEGGDSDPGRRERPSGPMTDDHDVEGPRPPEGLPDDAPDDLQQDHAADEGEQVPPALEHHQQDDQRKRRHRCEPKREGALDGVRDVREPRCPHACELSEDRRVEPVGEAADGGRVVGDDRPDQQGCECDQPSGAGRADVLGKRRRSAGRPATPPRAGRRRRRRQLRARDRRRFLLTGRDLVTDSHSSPCSSSHVRATAPRSSPPLATFAFNERRSAVVNRADTASTASTKSAPHRATSSERTKGVTFSDGWSPLSSSS